MPAAIAACPLEEPETVVIQGVCLRKARVRNCVREWIQEDEYWMHADTMELEHRSWSIVYANLFTLGSDTVMYEVGLAPVSCDSIDKEKTCAVIGAAIPRWYVATYRGGPLRVRHEAEATQLPSWAAEAAAKGIGPPNCAFQSPGAHAPAPER